MAIRIVQLGTPRVPQEGLRVGTVRRPPRDDERRCHRSVLRELLKDRGAKLAS